MADKTDPAKPTPDKKKFAPQNVADGSPEKGRNEIDMKDVSRGSEGDRRRSAQNRAG